MRPVLDSGTLRLGLSVFFATLFATLGTPLMAQSPVPNGFAVQGRFQAPQRLLVFDHLGTGDLVACDHTDLFTIDPQGRTRPVDKLPSNSSIAFVRAIPASNTVIIGDSGGDLFRHDLIPGSLRKIGHVPFSFDLVFDMMGQAFLSANPTFGTRNAGNEVFLLDCVTGATRQIAKLPGPSGPVEVSPDGSLFYAVQSDTHPTPRGFIRVLRFPRDRVLRAIAGNPMGEGDAQVWATGIDGAYGMVMDDRGRLLLSDPLNGGIARIGPAGGLEPRLLVDKAHLHTQQTMRFVKAGFGTFSPYQPTDAGYLFFVEDNRANTTTSIHVLHPKRPQGFSLPASPIPAGNFELGVADAPVGGAILCILSSTLLRAESQALMTGGDPLWYRVDPMTIFFMGVVATGASGTAKLGLVNPPEFQGQIGFQALVFGATGQLVGSSSHVEVTLL